MLKDEKLKKAAKKWNVARFASFSPDGKRRFCEMGGMRPWDINDAAEHLLRFCDSVNIRSFRESESGCPLLTGLDWEDAVREGKRLMARGYHVIVNENVPVDERMVSGVIRNGFVEAAPRDIPRCVEKGSCSSIPVRWAEKIFSLLLGTDIRLPKAENARIEFSAYARPVGTKSGNLLVWEDERANGKGKIRISEKDPFAEYLGDKAWGLLLAHAAGFAVPKTAIFRRGVFFPIALFGEDSGSDMAWTRACPKKPEPGRYYTARGFANPFEMMGKDDPENGNVVSALIQQEVPAIYAGAAMARGRILLIEGAEGFGDLFMAGKKQAGKLPQNIRWDIRELMNRLHEAFRSDLHVEWGHDGKKAWIFQLHARTLPEIDSCIIFPGKPEKWLSWHAEEGLESLRKKIARNPEAGMLLSGGCGFSSHAADICRKAKIPAMLVAERQ